MHTHHASPKVLMAPAQRDARIVTTLSGDIPRAQGTGSLSPVVSSSILTVSFSSRAHASSSQGSLLEVPLSVVLLIFRVFGPQFVPPLPACSVILSVHAQGPASMIFLCQMQHLPKCITNLAVYTWALIVAVTAQIFFSHGPASLSITDKHQGACLLQYPSGTALWLS